MSILEKPKNLLKKIGSWCRNHKIITVVLIVLVISASMFVYQSSKLFPTSAGQQQSYTFVRTTTLTKNGLEETVNCTGSVKSANTSTVSYNSMGGSATTKIKTVNFAVGDSVKEGDVIVVLDNTDILTKIEEEKEKLAEKVEQLLEKYEDAKEAYEDADDVYDDSKDTLSAAETALATAESNFKSAKNSISTFQKNYDNAYAAEEKAGKEYNDAYGKAGERCATQSEADNKVTAKKSAVETAETELENAKATLEASTEDDKTSLEEALTTAQSAYDTAKAEYDKAVLVQKATEKSIAYDNAKEARETAEKELATAKDACNYDSYEKAYSSAQSAYNSALSTKEQLELKRDTAKDSMELAEENYNDGQTSDTLEDLYEQLDDCNLVAETSGKITALNATVGAVPNGTIATIQDTDDLKIAVTISEADINSVSIGMSCNIRSDATENTIRGTLVQIDPVSGQSGNFGAEVKVNGTDTGLLVGMNADVDIVVSTVEDCFTVPIDAVGDDNDGKGSYIYRHTTGEGVDMEFEKIYVTTGESNAYYIEVYADQLAVGDVIRAYSDLTIGIEEISEEDMAEMGGMFGGMFGGMGGGMPGGMPSGGGMPGGMPSGGGFGGSGNGGSRPQMPSGGDFGGGNMPGGGMPGGFGG